MGRTRDGNRDSRRAEEAPEIAALCDEAVRFYLRMSALATTIHRQGPLSGPRRTVLAGLARSGPRTVAQMARDRSQSRQRIQPIVNSLLADGLVESMPNSAHKQSPLIAVTVAGRQEVARIHRREQAWRSRLQVSLPAARVTNALDVLRIIRLEMERLMREN